MIQGDSSFGDAFGELPWQYYLPIASALVLLVLGIIFKKTARDNI
jgi:hypothetical protein